MTRRTVRDAYSPVIPTQEQKDRMLQGILEKKNCQPAAFQKRKPVTSGHRSSVIAAGLSLAAVLALVIFIGEKGLPGLNKSAKAEAYSIDTEKSVLSAAQGTDQGTLNEEALPETGAADSTNANAETLYRPILEKYVTAIREQKNPGECSEDDISSLTGFLQDLSQLGWYLTDLDGNGTEELIVSDGDVIYDLYTVENGSVVHVLTGRERDAYWLCDNGIIKNCGSNGVASTIYGMYRLSGSNLVQEQMVTYDGTIDPDNGWFISFEMTPASEADAQAMIDSYQEIKIPITLLSEETW